MLNQSKEMVLETIREMDDGRKPLGGRYRALTRVVDLVNKLGCKPADIRPVLKELVAEHWIVIVKHVGDYDRIRVNDAKAKAADDYRMERYRAAKALREQLEAQNNSDSPIYIDNCWDNSEHRGAVCVSLTVTAYDDRTLDLIRQIERLSVIATRPRESGPLLINQAHCDHCGRITGNGQYHECEP